MKHTSTCLIDLVPKSTDLSLILTPHARKRLQQRGIPEAAILTCVLFGTLHYAGQGRLAYHIDRRALATAQVDGIQLYQYSNIACIIAENHIVVTVEHAPRKPKHWKKGGGR